MPGDDSHRLFRAIHDSVVAGDLEGLRAALGDPEGFPNVHMDPAAACGDIPLVYALYHAPLSLVRDLLALGAEPNGEPGDGFPPIFAAIDSNHADSVARVALLLDHGADPDQRGVNDFTTLHFAVSWERPDVIELLLARGADPTLRTRIDDCETPLDYARATGSKVCSALLEAAMPAAEPAHAGNAPATAGPVRRSPGKRRR